MDGTALNDNKEFSGETLHVFAELRRRGIAYTIASARTPMMLGVYCAEAEISSVPLIALEGAVVQRMDGSAPIYELPLSREYAVGLCEACHNMGADYTVYTSKSCYMRRDTHRMWRFEPVSYTHLVTDQFITLAIKPVLLSGIVTALITMMSIVAVSYTHLPQHSAQWPY